MKGYQIDEEWILRAFDNSSRYVADELGELDEDGRREALLDVLDSMTLNEDNEPEYTFRVPAGGCDDHPMSPDLGILEGSKGSSPPDEKIPDKSSSCSWGS